MIAHHHRALIFLIATTTLAGCASNQTSRDFNEHFVPRIEDNGLKLFSYTLTTAAPPTRADSRSGGRSGGRGGKGSSGPANKEQQLYDTARKKLEQTLEANGYCREGFIEIERHTGRGYLQIRGECREGASAEDIQTFGG